MNCPGCGARWYPHNSALDIHCDQHAAYLGGVLASNMAGPTRPKPAEPQLSAAPSGVYIGEGRYRGYEPPD